MPRSLLLFEGLLAGGAFALADLLACGLPLDSALPIWVAAGGLLLGVLGGAAGAAAQRPGVATAVVVLLAHGLQWSAIASREWFPAPAGLQSPQAPALLAAVAASALVAAVGAAVLVHSTLRLSAIFAAPPLVPAFAFFAAFQPRTPWPGLAFAFGPGVVLLLVALLAARGARVRGALAIPALIVAIYAGALHPAFTAVRRARREPLPPAAARAGHDAPDLLLILVDTLRADHVRDGRHSPGTPALDRLAASGVEFTQAVSSAAWTLPSHASLFTGRAPADHGAVTAAARLRGGVPTLAQRLHDAGYATAAFTGGGFLVAATGLDAGFEEFDARAELPDHVHARHTPLVLRVARNRFAPLWPVVNGVPTSGGLARVARRACEWWGDRDRSRPSFLFVHTYQVHDYYVHQGAWDRPDGPGPVRPRFSGRFAGRLWVEPDEIVAGIGDEETESLRRIYSRRVELVDAEIGRLLESVRAESAGRPLVVVVTSDHGEGFDAGEGRLMHGGRLHDDQLLVPLLMSGREFFPVGRRVDAQVRLVDLMPTLLELAGAAVPDDLEGVSLVPLLRGEEESRLAWSEDGAGAARRVSVRTPGWKLIRRDSELEAFDLAADPLERANRADAAPRGLRERLEQLLAERPLEQTAGAEFDAAASQHLRELGYIR